MSISKIIKDRRTELDITLKEIADKVGVSEATVQRWESGNIANMRHNRIAKLAEVLKVSPAVLMGWDGVPTEKDRKREEIYKAAMESDDPVVQSLFAALNRILGIDQTDNDETK